MKLLSYGSGVAGCTGQGPENISHQAKAFFGLLLPTTHTGSEMHPKSGLNILPRLHAGVLS